MTDTPEDLAEAFTETRQRALKEMCDVEVGTDQYGNVVEAGRFFTLCAGVPTQVTAAVLSKMAAAYDAEMMAEWRRFFDPVKLPEKSKPFWRAFLDSWWPVARFYLAIFGALSLADTIWRAFL